MKIEQSFVVKRIIGNALVGWLAKIIIAVSGVFLTPILISGLGKYEYGIWALVGQLISLLLIADFGVASSVGRLIAKYDALDSLSNKVKVYSTALLIFFFSMLLLSIIFLFTLAYVPGWLDITPDYHNVTIYVFLIMIINLIISFPLRVGRGLLQAAHRFDYIDIAATIAKLSQLLIVCILFYKGEISLLALAWTMAITNALTELSIFLISKKVNKEIQFDIKSIDTNSIKEIFSLGGASVFKSASGLMSQQGMVFLVGIMLGIIYVPLYSIPLLLLVIIGTLIGKIGTSFMPAASAYDSLAETKKILNLSVYGVRYTFMLGLLACVYILFYGKILLTLWLPGEEINSVDLHTMYMILQIVIVPFILARSNQGNRVILSSTGQHWLVSNILFVSSVLSVLIAILLVSFTDLGLYSFAVGWVVKLLLGDYLLLLCCLFKRYSVDVLKYCYTGYFKPICAIAPVIFFAIFMREVIEGTTVLWLVIESALFFFVSVVCLCVFCIEKNHMNIIVPKRLQLSLKKS